MNGGKRERYPLNYWMAQIFFLQVLLDIHHKVLYLTPAYDSSSAKNKVFLVCSADWRRPRQQTRLIVEYLTFGKRPPISIYKELDGKWPRNPESIPFLLRLAIILQIRFITLRLLPVTSRRWYVKIADPNMRSRFLGRPPLPPPLSSNSDVPLPLPRRPVGLPLASSSEHRVHHSFRLLTSLPVSYRVVTKYVLMDVLDQDYYGMIYLLIKHFNAWSWFKNRRDKSGASCSCRPCHWIFLFFGVFFGPSYGIDSDQYLTTLTFVSTFHGKKKRERREENSEFEKARERREIE